MNDHSYLIPTAPDLPHGLGRHVHHDPANFQPEHLALVAPPPRSPVPFRTWSRTVMFDQGDSPSCTIHAFTGVCRTTPFAATFSDRLKLDSETELRAAYEETKLFDPYPGTDYDGTSSDAPFRWARSKGYISGWKWLRGETEVREYLKWYGPVCIGSVWRMDMFYPDARHYLNCTGEDAGGHEYELVYYSVQRDAYRLVNSWGYGWGDSGRAWLRSRDLAALLEADGDAITLTPA